MQETIFGIIIVLTSTFFVLFLFAIIYINKYFREKENSHQNLYASILDAQEKERREIASDIHDELGGILTAVKISISAISNDSAIGATYQDRLKQIQAHLGALTTMVRDVSNSLSPTSNARYGLKGALSDLVERTRNLGYTIDFNYQLTSTLSESLQINLYRIINEVFNNALKHANASELYLILLESESNKILVKVGDNGKGFDMKKANINAKTNGMNNLQNRCKYINAQLVFESNPNQGAHYQISFQINP